MPRYVMERDIPNVGGVTREQVIAISSKVVQRAASSWSENSMAA